MPHAHPPGYPSPDPTPLRFSEMADGYAGTVDVINEMRTMILGAYSDEYINTLARQLVQYCKPRDYTCEATSLLSYMRNFRYTGLPANRALQRIQTALYTLRDSPAKSGECASLSVALGALLMSIGRGVKLRVGGRDPVDPSFFEHVWLLVDVPGMGWVPADPSYPLQPLGWEHPNVLNVQDFEVG